jgi:hypothetical protein
MQLRHAFVAFLAVLASLWIARLCTAEQAIDYDRQIRPILSQHCFHCHGPDGKHREAGLRFDDIKNATSELESGETAIVPGKPDDSALVARIFTSDKDEVMPPPESNRDLNDKQKKLLKQWIAEGAKFEEHWAFQTPKRPELPKVSQPDWPRNSIDHFIMNRLDAKKMHPSSEASKETLIRRLSLDLTGLPPTPKQVDAFLAEKSPSAYEKLVDRLLASPRYGEHMAHAWLDAARYADTNGYQNDGTRTMWPWRDWVVRALNENQPFNDFTIEQLAGDLLPNPTDSQRLATGFHRNHMLNGEGGRIAEESRVEYVVDRVSTTGSVWLGMTVGCARCHDHKYDPISHEDFYRMYAFFNSIEERGNVDRRGNANPVMKLPTPAQQKDSERLSGVLASLEKQIRTESDAAALARWEKRVEHDMPPAQTWETLIPAIFKSQAKAELSLGTDGTIFVKGVNAKNDNYTIEAATDAQNITGIRLSALTHPSFTAGGFARSNSGNFVLTGFEVDVTEPGQKKPRRVKIARVEADYHQDGFPPNLCTDGNSKTGWAVMSANMKQNRTAVFTFDKPIPAGKGTKITVRMKHESIHAHHNLGRFRLAATSWRKPSFEPLAVTQILKIDPRKRSAEQKKAILDYFRSTDPRVGAIQKQIDQTKSSLASVKKSYPETMVMAERKKPRDTYRLIRGSWDQPDKTKKLTPRVPEQWLAMPKDAPANRLGLARWLVDPKHPLTSRVTVNRYWQHFFGTGIVKTPEEFGSQGDPPSHPQLMDWLSTQFVRSGWDVKAMHRLIVLSATYRQSSKTTPAMLEQDPYNRLLGRGARFRLTSQAIRDQALAISGLLVEKMGGPGVKPYQPLGIWDDATLGKIKYKVDSGEKLYRRSLYTFWRRMVGPTMFFDTSARQNCTVRLNRTNTPLHALTLLNDITYVEAARKLGERMMREGGTQPKQRIAWAMRLATAQNATPQQVDVLMGVYQKMLARYQADAKAADKLLAVGQSPCDKSLDAVELAAFTCVANIILNLDEVVTKE